MSTLLNRRDFQQQSMGALVTWSLLELLGRHDLWAAEVKQAAARWVADVNQLGLDLKGQKLDQLTWQQKVEELLARVDLTDLKRLIDFERLAQGASFSAKGERSLRFSFPQVEGLPAQVCFGKQIFALRQGRSVVPHGHNNMATAFLILEGDLRGRHYDRVQDEPGYMHVRPTLDRKFTVGECATISDYKDNVHWFQALTERAFIFNMHLLDVHPGSKLPTGRVYIDPQGEPLAEGVLRCRVINYKQAAEMYG